MRLPMAGVVAWFTAGNRSQAVVKRVVAAPANVRVQVVVLLGLPRRTAAELIGGRVRGRLLAHPTSPQNVHCRDIRAKEAETASFARISRQ